MRATSSCACFLALAFATVAAQTAPGAPAAPERREPQISNRTAKPGEIGYRPADGSTARFNPPSLTWLHEPGAHTYDVEWSLTPDFADATTADRLPFNTYTHSSPLAHGQYCWRYRFVTKQGKVSDWSVARRFTVNSSAVEFPMPTRAQQRERVPRDHPRLLLRPEDLPRLRTAARGKGGEEPAQFASLRAAAEKLLKAQPTPEPTVRGSARDDSMRAFWWPNRVQTEKACQEAETLAFVYLMTGEQKYGAAARKWILHLASWDPDGPTNFKLNCEAAKPMLWRLPRAYDWAYDALTPDDRDRVRQAMRRRALDAWESGEVGRGVGHLNRPYCQPRQPHLPQARRVRDCVPGRNPGGRNVARLRHQQILRRLPGLVRRRRRLARRGGLLGRLHGQDRLVAAGSSVGAAN